MTVQKTVLKAHPATIVLVGFLLAIIVGMLLLKLPIATRSGFITWVDALFTSTSAVCVTGLAVLDTGTYFSLFGQCVILVLIQIGGLGVMTISVALFQWAGRTVSFRHRLVMQDLFSHTPREDIFGLVRSVFLFTLGAELVGALFLTVHWARELPIGSAAYTAVFHSVSAFCNAGFGLFPDSLMRYCDSLLLNFVICCLIIVGGIGFPVLYDIQSWYVRRKKERARLSVHTKTVLLTTAALIVLGAVMFAFSEREALGHSPAFTHGILAPIFQSITCRTAGFNTVDIGSLQESTLAVMIFLMFFGASPGSCGGGVKTTTLALLTAFTVSRVIKSKRVNIFKKSIPNETVGRSVSLLLLSVVIIGLVLFFLLMGDSATGHRVSGPRGVFLMYLFETVSAFGTVGLSIGVTPELDTWGKCLITIMMIIGRVGVLTFAYIIVGTGASNGVEYAEENLMIG